jgi:hypothetical protein
MTLKQFLAELATDPTRMTDYLSNPDDVLKSSGLSEEDQTALKSKDTAAIQDRLEGPPASAAQEVIWRAMTSGTGQAIPGAGQEVIWRAMPSAAGQPPTSKRHRGHPLIWIIVPGSGGVPDISGGQSGGQGLIWVAIPPDEAGIDPPTPSPSGEIIWVATPAVGGGGATPTPAWHIPVIWSLPPLPVPILRPIPIPPPIPVPPPIPLIWILPEPPYYGVASPTQPIWVLLPPPPPPPPPGE